MEATLEDQYGHRRIVAKMLRQEQISGEEEAVLERWTSLSDENANYLADLRKKIADPIFMQKLRSIDKKAEWAKIVKAHKRYMRFRWWFDTMKVLKRPYTKIYNGLFDLVMRCLKALRPKPNHGLIDSDFLNREVEPILPIVSKLWTGRTLSDSEQSEFDAWAALSPENAAFHAGTYESISDPTTKEKIRSISQHAFPKDMEGLYRRFVRRRRFRYFVRGTLRRLHIMFFNAIASTTLWFLDVFRPRR